ncbi:hypothetical protein [Euzebyella saccharophila]|uniref:Pentapeptide repeat-containing protein n=1 Tax=Euzebyella saccharophila TaxID=679664 RepID=A0ABV8JT32_9FLAO|nr:hypothetical protein [Euzebyella saccharophila]
MDFSEIIKNLKHPGKSSFKYSHQEFSFLGETFNAKSIGSMVIEIEFLNCIFRGAELFFESIKNTRLSIRFIDCRFECKIEFNSCILSSLKFIDTKISKHQLTITCNTIDHFFLKNRNKKTEDSLDGDISITLNTFKQQVNLDNLKHVNGNFEFHDNVMETDVRKKGNHRIIVSFKNSRFNNADFSLNNFGAEASFDNMQLSGNLGENSFQDNTFGNVYFNNTNFGKHAFFNGSIFNGLTLFVGCRNLETETDFSSITFNSDVYFDKSNFKDLTIKNTVFKQKSSFEDTTFESVSFSQVIFQSQAFFQNIKIKQIKLCSRKTIRAIKAQLQKTDNRIDYNRFKAYELDAYRRELKPNQWKEKFILWLNSISSNHGLDWTKSVAFTLGVALLFYLIYFYSEHYLYDLDFTINSINRFVVGYLKYLIPSYKSPFEHGFSKWFQLLIYMVGKIFIAYGIYQTIVSFRKYRI